MEIRNYLSRDHINYSIILKEQDNQTIQLWEHIDGMQREFQTMLSVVYSWRADLMKSFLDSLISSYQETKRNNIQAIQTRLELEDSLQTTKSTQWNHDYRLPEEIAMKMLMGMKLASTMDQRPRIEEAMEVLKALSDEEISFWAWKTLSLKTAALNGFKAMYL